MVVFNLLPLIQANGATSQSLYPGSIIAFSNGRPVFIAAKMQNGLGYKIGEIDKDEIHPRPTLLDKRHTLALADKFGADRVISSKYAHTNAGKFNLEKSIQKRRVWTEINLDPPIDPIDEGSDEDNGEDRGTSSQKSKDNRKKHQDEQKSKDNRKKHQDEDTPDDSSVATEETDISERNPAEKRTAETRGRPEKKKHHAKKVPQDSDDSSVNTEETGGTEFTDISARTPAEKRTAETRGRPEKKKVLREPVEQIGSSTEVDGSAKGAPVFGDTPIPDVPRPPPQDEEHVTQAEQEHVPDLLTTHSELPKEAPVASSDTTVVEGTNPFDSLVAEDESRFAHLMKIRSIMRNNAIQAAEANRIDDYSKIEEGLAKIQADMTRLKGAGQEDLMKAAREDAAAELLEEEKQAAQTAAKIMEEKEKEDAPETLLSAGLLAGGVTPTSAETGATAETVAVHHVMDLQTADSAKPLVESADQFVDTHTALITEMDKGGDVLMGTNESGADKSALEEPTEQNQTGTTGANAMAIADEMMEEDSKISKEEIETAQNIRKHDEQKSSNPFDSLPPDSDLSMENIELTDKTELVTIDDISKVLNKMIKVSADNIPLSDRIIATQDLLKTQIRGRLSTLTHGLNLSRVGAPNLAEQATGLLGETLTGMVAKGSIGNIPIFAPQKSFEAIADLQQKGVTTMTLADRQTHLDQMAPWWNEFRTLQLSRAVQEMERMPTRVLTSPTGSVQHGSKPRQDVDSGMESFGDFMFWVLRDKLAPLESGITWTKFFEFTSTLGYNDLTQGQINWFITGNPDGDISKLVDTSDFSEIAFNPDKLGLKIRISDLKLIDKVHVDIAHATLLGTPDSETPYPGKNVSPSADAAGVRRDYRIVDGHLRAVVAGSLTPEEAGRHSLEGIPNRVSNIPDPRFSKRGGVNVPNVRIVTIRNPEYDPKIKEGEKGFQPEFITKEVPDIGAGSHEVEGEIQKAEADRLLENVPLQLYAPIHPQACDRYLGKKNYQRLGTPIEQYMKHYSQHPWGPEDIQSMYSWNQTILILYGPMLYAFVTDIAMQRTEPVYPLSMPKNVQTEYMELNELLTELKKFQAASEDRADRVGDSGVGREPIEKHLDTFFKDQQEEQDSKLADMNAVIIALPDEPIPTGGGAGGGDGPGDNPPPAPPDGPAGPSQDASGPGAVPSPIVPPSTAPTVGLGFGNTVGAEELDQGIRRNVPFTPYSGQFGRSTPATPVIEKSTLHETMFRKLNRR